MEDDQFGDLNPTGATEVQDEFGLKVKRSVPAYSRVPGKCCRAFFAIVFSQLGTLLLLIGYLIGGGYMFRYLELSNEYTLCEKKSAVYFSKLGSTVERVQGIVLSGLAANETRKNVYDALVSFAGDVYTLDFEPSKNCSAIMNSTYGAQWNLFNSIYFCATIVTTIGYGQVAPMTFWGRIVCMFYAVVGIPIMLIYLASIGDLLARIFRFMYVNLCCCRCCNDVLRNRRKKRRELLKKLREDLHKHRVTQASEAGELIPPLKVQVVDDDSDTDEEEAALDTYDSSQDLSVPIMVSVAVLSGYVMLGSFLFRIWEKEWTINDGAYFSFITLSTIGFGDLVPGKGKFDKPETVTELIIGAIYCIFGLALLSMCLNLVQNEFVTKSTWLGKKIGLISTPKFEEDEEALVGDDDNQANSKEGRDNEAFSN